MPSRYLLSDRERFVDGGGYLTPTWYRSLLTLEAAMTPPATAVVDITSFGAVGDGVTDSTSAIQAAIDAAYAAGGGTVSVPVGTFICGALTYKSRVTIAGCGWSSILKMRDGLNDGWISPAAPSADDVAFLNLTFDGNQANNTSGNALYLGGQRIRIDGCYFTNVRFNAVYFGGTVATLPNAGYALVAHCQFHNCGSVGYGPIAVVHGRHIDIRSNRFTCDTGGMTYAIDIEPNDASEAVHDIVIEGNTIQGGRIFLDCNGMSSPGTNYTITGNVIDARGSGLDYGFFDNCVPIYLRKIDGLLISDNVLYGRTDSHRQMIEVATSIAKFQITDNLVFCGKHASLATYAINFPFSANCAVDGRIAGNHFLATTSIALGISSFHPTAFSNVVVRDNHFTNVTSPYVINTLDTPAFGVKVVSVSGDYAVSGADGAEHLVVLADATSADLTVSLYSASSQRGRRITVVKTDASSHLVTINPDTGSGERWAGKATVTLAAQFDSRTAMSNHLGWDEHSRRTKPFFLDVKTDFGAKGDGTSNDTAAIQAALNAASPGEVVFFPAGTYICNRAFFKAGNHVMGVGAGSVLKLGAGQNSAILDTADATAYLDDVHVETLTFDGNRANNTGGGGIAWAGRRGRIAHCTFKDADGAAIQFGGFSNGVTNIPDASVQIVNNTITNCATGILVTHGTRCQIRGNVIVNSDGDMTYAIAAICNTGNAASKLLIEGNTIEGGSIWLDAHLASMTDVTVVGNFVDVRGFTGTVGDTTVPLYLSTVDRLHVGQNVLIGHADGYHGGIYVAGAITKFSFVGNTIFPSDASTSYAIRFANTASLATDGVIANNVITGLETVDYGIYSPHASGWSNVESFGNRFRSVTVHHYVNQTGIAVGPSSEWTKTRTWNTGAMGDGTAATTTVTVEGAAVGDWIHAAFKSLPANVFGMASVTAADTVTLSLFNKSGGSVTFNDQVRLVLRKYTNESTGVY